MRRGGEEEGEEGMGGVGGEGVEEGRGRWRRRSRGWRRR